jgi:uncharacterized membrane protein
MATHGSIEHDFRPMPSSSRSSARETRERRLHHARLSPSARRAADRYRSWSGQRQISGGLGWLSVGLGLTGLLAPRQLGRAIGVPAVDLLQFIGVRELATGAALLTKKNAEPWLWSRLVGDAMDVSVLAAALRSNTGTPRRTWAALSVVAAIGAVDFAAALNSRAQRVGSRKADEFLEHSIIINRPPAACYEFWRNLSNLPQFMPRLESVTVLDQSRSYWRVRGPGGLHVGWGARIVVDDAGQQISWHSEEGSELRNAGTVRFSAAPGNRGTLVRLQMHYQPPVGRTAVKLAKLIGSDPNAELREDLRRFKRLLETGEIPTTQGQPSGRRSLLGRAFREGRLSRSGGQS